MAILYVGNTATPSYIGADYLGFRSDNPFTVTVAGDDDDAHEGDDGNNFVRVAIHVRVTANATQASRRNGGFRFRSINIPQGSTIVSAVMAVSTSQSSLTLRDIYADIFGEDADNSVDYSTNGDVTSRTRTSASVSWNAEDIGQNVYTNSPSIVAVIQEIIDRAGWQSGNALSLLLIGQSSTSKAVDISSATNSNGKAAQLTVEFIAAQLIALPVAIITATAVAPAVTPGGVSIAAPVAGITLTGVAPTVSGALAIPVTPATITLTAVAPTVSAGAVSTAIPVASIRLCEDYPYFVARNAPVAYWRLNDGNADQISESSQTLTLHPDSALNDASGLLNKPLVADNAIENIWTPDGAWLDMAAFPALGDVFTVAFLLRRGALGVVETLIHFEPSGVGFAIGFDADDNLTLYDEGDPGVEMMIALGSPLDSTSATYHLVVQKSGTTRRIWINGVSSGLNATNATVGGGSGSLTVFRNPNRAGTETAVARLDELAIFDRFLSTAQVAALYELARNDALTVDVGIAAALPVAVITLTAIAPTVTAALALALPVAGVSLTGVAPAVTKGALSVAVTPAAVTLTGVAPAVTKGAVSVAIAPAAVTISGVTPTVTKGGVSLAVAPASVTLTAVAPAVAAGAVSVGIGPALVTLAAIAPAVSLGAVLVAVAPAGVVLTGVAPAPALGAVSVALTVAVITLTGVAPGVSVGGTPQSVPLPVAVVTLTGVAPAVASGAITIAITPTAVTLTGITPTLTLGAVSVSVTPSVITLTGIAPAVTSAITTVAIPVAIVTITGVTPTVTPSAISLAITPTVITLTAVAPALSGGAPTIAITPAVVTISGVAPAVALGAVSAALPPVVITLTAVAPTLVYGPAIPVAIITITAITPGVTVGAVTLALPIAVITLTALPPEHEEEITVSISLTASYTPVITGTASYVPVVELAASATIPAALEASLA